MSRHRQGDDVTPSASRFVHLARLLLVLLGLMLVARAGRLFGTTAEPSPQPEIVQPDRTHRDAAPSPTRFVQAVRLLLVLLGFALLARAGLLFKTTIKSSQWPEIAVWLAVGVLLHDALIAPFTLLLARIVHPGPVLRAGWLGAGVCVLLAIPLLKGAAQRRNPTVIPHAPGPELLRALVVVAVGMLLAVAIARARGAYRART